MKTRKTSTLLRILGLALVAGLGFASSADAATKPDRQEAAPAPCCALEAAAPLGAQTEEIRLDAVMPAAILTRIQTHGTTKTPAAEVVFYRDVSVGEKTLAPGRYQVRHVAAQGSHFIRFTPVGEAHHAHKSVEVACSLEPLKEAAGETLPRLRVDSGGLTLLKLYFAGERAAHAF